MAAEQQSLLELFAERGAPDLARRGGDDRISPRRYELAALILNPFSKQFGECVAGCRNEQSADPVRVFWCWGCGRKFCWGCFLHHSD